MSEEGKAKQEDGFTIATVEASKVKEGDPKVLKLDSDEFRALNEKLAELRRAWGLQTTDLGALYRACGSLKNHMDKVARTHDPPGLPDTSPTFWSSYDRLTGVVTLNDSPGAVARMEEAVRKAGQQVDNTRKRELFDLLGGKKSFGTLQSRYKGREQKAE
jgi:hypothetical protein